MKTINVMLTDDHVLIREGIKHLLEFDGTIKVIEEANDGIECLEKLNKVTPDVLLLQKFPCYIWHILDKCHYIYHNHICYCILNILLIP